MKLSWMVAVVIAGAAAAWIASGQMGDASGRPEAQEGQQLSTEIDRPLARVQVAAVTTEPMQDRLTLQGRSQADRVVHIRAETRGPIETVLVDRGQRVTEGDVVVRLDIDVREARVASAEATVEQYRVEFIAAERLNERGFSADITLNQARAALDRARADLQEAELDLERTEISAPFTGVIDSRPVEIGDFVDVGDVIATLVDLDPIVIVGQISERNLNEVAMGSVGNVTFIDGTTRPGVVSYIGRIADDATRTFPVEIQVANPDYYYIAGLTAELSLPIAQVMAHRVSPAVLTIHDDGRLGVKVVDDEDRVVFHEVTILGDSGEGLWIGGLPDQVDLITVGHDFVREGQQVIPVRDTQEPQVEGGGS